MNLSDRMTALSRKSAAYHKTWPRRNAIVLQPPLLVGCAHTPCRSPARLCLLSGVPAPVQHRDLLRTIDLSWTVLKSRLSANFYTAGRQTQKGTTKESNGGAVTWMTTHGT